MKKARDLPIEPKISHILGVDYGEAKIGLALADRETKMAFAYATLKNDKNLMDNLTKIVREKSVEKIIIGVPSFVNRKETVYPGEKFGEKLEKIFSRIKIEYQNEIFSTKLAQENLIEKGIRNIKEFDDQEAARIILQSYLDKSKYLNGL